MLQYNTYSETLHGILFCKLFVYNTVNTSCSIFNSNLTLIDHISQNVKIT